MIDPSNFPASEFARICERFEEIWQQGVAPNMVDFLSRESHQYPQRLLEELLIIDIRNRSRLTEDGTVDPAIYESLGNEIVEIAKKILGRRATCDAEMPLDLSSSIQTSIVPVPNSPTETVEPTVGSSIRIGPYKLLQRIGEGGMGTVWMADQESPFRRRVALKLIKGARDDKQVIARFEAERQALAMMNHPNIARVFDAGTTENGTPYFAMELVQGIPFNKYCDQNKLTPRERLKLFIPVCKAIQHAHQKGVIHRDLKPTNVLVCVYDGEPIAKVIDFGLAKALQHELKLTEKTMFTEFGTIVGTIQYMSPEQAALDALDVDTRTDIYSLGAMLYEQLVGSTPIEDSTLKKHGLLQILEFIREKDPPRPSDRLSSAGSETQSIGESRQVPLDTLRQLLRGDLDWIVMKALEKDRTRRYETASDMGNDIQRFLEGDTIKARPPSASYALRKFARKYRGWVATATSMFALLIVGVFAIAISFFRAESARKEAEAALARSSYFLANSRWKEKRGDEALALLNNVPMEYRNLEWHLAYQRFQGSSLTLYGHGTRVHATDFSPDGTKIISSGDDGKIILWDAVSGAMLRSITGSSSAIRYVVFSSDGSRFASAEGLSYASGTEKSFSIRIWDTQTGNLIRELNGHSDSVSSLCFSPDGKMIASASGERYGKGTDCSIRLWDIESGSTRKTISGHSGSVNCLDISPDGKRIVSSSHDNTIRLWDMSDGHEIWKTSGVLGTQYVCFTPDGTGVMSMSTDRLDSWDVDSGLNVKTLRIDYNWGLKGNTVDMSPDGEFVALCNDAEIEIKRVASGERVAIRNGHAGGISCIRFSPDGRRFVTSSSDGTLKIWLNNQHADDGMRVRHLRDGIHVNGVRYAPNGNFLVASGRDNDVTVWDALTKQRLFTMLGHKTRVSSIAVSQDSRLIASGGRFEHDKNRDCAIRIWESEEGKLLRQLEGNDDSILDLHFNTNGNRLASVSGNQEGSKNDIRIWDVESGKQLKRFRGIRAKHVRFVPDGDGDSVAIGCANGQVVLLNVTTGKISREFHGAGNTITALSFNRDGQLLAAASDFRSPRICIWSAKTGELLRTLVGAQTATETNDLEFTPDGKRILSCGGHNLTIWDVENGDEVCRLEPEHRVVTVDVNHDGTQFASSGYESTFEVSGLGVRETDILGTERSPIRRVSYSPDLELIAVGCDSEVSLWESRTRKCVWSFRCLDVVNVGFNKEGKKLFIKSGAHQIVLDIATGKEVGDRFNADDVFTKSISEKDHKLITGFGRLLLLVDLDFKNQIGEQQFRQLIAKPDPLWHLERAESSISSNNIFSTRFHLDKALQCGFDGSENHSVSTLLLSVGSELLWVREFALAESLLRKAIAIGQEVHPNNWQTFEAQSLLGEAIAKQGQRDSSEAKMYLESGYKGLKDRASDFRQYSPNRLEQAVDRLIAFAIDSRQAEEEAKWESEKRSLHEVLRSQSLPIHPLEPMTTSQANRISYRIWERVRLPQGESHSRLSPGELHEIRIVVTHHPLGMYYKTLAVAEFRMNHYEEAIAASLKSVELWPKERNQASPYPSNLAVLAMCHHKLGNVKKANEYRRQLIDSMKSNAYENDKDCISFLAEANVLFDAAGDNDPQ